MQVHHRHTYLDDDGLAAAIGLLAAVEIRGLGAVAGVRGGSGAGPVVEGAVAVEGAGVEVVVADLAVAHGLQEGHVRG